MDTIITPKRIELPPGAVLKLLGGWKDYQLLSQQLGDRSSPRIKYRRGEILLMAPLPEHGRDASLLALIVIALLDHLNRIYDSFTPITMSLPEISGIEPDYCFYIENCRAVVGKKRIDWESDPPPDLAIEIDVTSYTDINDFLPYRVPEGWILKSHQLLIYRLQAESYVLTESSYFHNVREIVQQSGLSTQSQGNIIQTTPKKNKKNKKKKNKEVKPENLEASEQETVNEQIKTTTTLLTTVLSISQQKIQTLEAMIDSYIAGLVRIEKDKPLGGKYSAEDTKVGWLESLESSKDWLKELQAKEEKIQNKCQFIPRIEDKMNKLKLQPSNDEEYNKTKNFLEKNLKIISELQANFFNHYKAGSLNENLSTLENLLSGSSWSSRSSGSKTVRDLGARLNEFLDLEELSLPMKQENIFVNGIKKLDRLHLSISKLLQNAIAGNLLDKATLKQVSDNVESWILEWDRIRTISTNFQNEQNNKKEKIQEFINDYNFALSMIKAIDDKQYEISNQIDRGRTSEFQKTKLHQDMQKGFKVQYDYIVKFSVADETYKSQMKEDIADWENTYGQELKKLFANIRILEESFNSLSNNLQEKIAQALSLQDNKEEDSQEDSQEDSSLLTENPENILNEIDTLDIDSQESEQPFQISGKSKQGKTISGKASKKTIPKVGYDRDGKFKYLGEEQVNDISFFKFAEGAKLVRVEFDPQLKLEQRQQLYDKPFFKLGQTIYRFDLLNSGERDFTWAIEADKDNLSTRIHPFDEPVAYTRQALFTTPLATYTDSQINGAAVRDKTPFVLEKTDGIELMVSDGWGFIKASFAEKLIAEIKSKKPSAPTPKLKKPALPNTQMLQWLPLDNKLIFELVENGIKELSQISTTKNQSSAVQDMQKEKLYRAVTTGNFLVKVGTAMPVPAEEVVLPPGILAGNAKVALHRSPADTMNWTTGRVAASENPLAQAIAKMTALQYRWTGHEMGYEEPPFVFYKGMLGVIPDENWPSKYKTMNANIVVCAEDRKVDQKWKQPADIDKSKKTETQFKIKGDFKVSKLLEPGSLIGVPSKMMKNLSGDFDGDEVHMLAQSDSPALFHVIELQEQVKISNPKLEKDRKFPQLSVSSSATQDNPGLLDNSFVALNLDEKNKIPAEAPKARSLAPRLIDMLLGQQLVGIWSTIADLLRTVNPLRLDKELCEDIGKLIVEKPLENQQELWQYVGLGIKAGTDLAKTNLERTEFLGRKLTAQQLMSEGKTLMKFLIEKKKLKNPHKRRNQESIVEDIRNNRRLRVVHSEKYNNLNVRGGHYGNLFEIMLAMDLHLETTRSGQNLICRGDLAPSQLERGTKAIEKARKWKDEITDQEVFVLKIYEILDNLKRLLYFNYKEKEYARENSSLWTLLVIKQLQPAKLRQELYAQSSPTPAAGLQVKYDNLLNQIQKLWNQFTSSDHDQGSVTNEDAKEQSNYIISDAAQETLRGLQLQNQNIAPNGDCLYNALIDMGASSGSAHDSRKALADFVNQNYQHNEVLRAAVDTSGQTLAEFTNDIRDPGSFANQAGDISPQLLSMFLNINIHVINQDGSITPASEGSGNGNYYLVRFLAPPHFNATKSQ